MMAMMTMIDDDDDDDGDGDDDDNDDEGGIKQSIASVPFLADAAV